MTKSELIRALSKKLPEIQCRDVELAANCMLKQMVDAMEKGERIEIRGFGNFSVRHRPPRLARNPKTGEVVSLSIKRVAHFKPGKQMRDRVNSGRNQCKITE